MFRQLPAWSPLTLGAILAGFRAAWLSDGGAARRAVDHALRAAYEPLELYLTDSGTSALTIALQVVGTITKAPVALPAYCCYDVATAAEGAGTPFLLYDLDPATLSPDLASLRLAFEAGARSVVVAHLYGVPADLDSIRALALEFGAILIEDAAQGSGCEWRGKPTGTYGALGILSFGRGKGVTGGKGGALLVNDAQLVAATSVAWQALTGPRDPRGSLTDYALLKAQWLFGRPALYWLPASIPFLALGDTRYRSPHEPAALSRLAAGVLSQTLPLGKAEAQIRRRNAIRLTSGLLGTRIRWPTPPLGGVAGFLRLPVLLEGDLVPSRTVSQRLGIMPGYPRTLAALHRFGPKRQNGAQGFPGAGHLASHLWTIPTHGVLTEAHLGQLELWCRTVGSR